MITYATPAAYEDYDPDAERHHGEPADRVTLYSPTGAELFILDVELEQFERDTHKSITADCLDAAEWQRLIRWLTKNYDLIAV